jgi:hypothetical protein
MSFEANRGQTAPQVDFVSRGSGYTVFLTQDEAVLALRDNSLHHKSTTNNITLRMHFIGASHDAQGTGLDELAGKSNYFIGNDPKQWHNDISTFGKVKYHDIYKGVDLLYYGTQQQLEYDMIVAPGADVKQIAFGFQEDHAAGGNKNVTLHVDRNGNLVSSDHRTEVLLRKPTVYQLLTNNTGTTEKKVVETNYVVRNGKQVGFAVASYDKTSPLVIDPVVPFYSTYLGGTNNDYGFAIAADANGDAYITGATESLNFPVAGCLQCANAGLYDVFVTELKPGGVALIYSTYLGGKGNDLGYGIAVDGAGDTYVTGSTTSKNFPVLGCVQCVLGGGADAFVTELKPLGAGLVYSTYLGGKGNDYGKAIAIDPAGDAYVTGNTISPNFPVIACLQCVIGGGIDAFVTEVKALGAGLVYSTYLGGVNDDYGYGIAVNANDNAFVTGSTLSPNFPTTPPNCFQCGPQGLSDAFVTHIAPFGASLVNSTYLGGPGNDYGYAIALADQELVFVTGSTASVAFPVGPCFQCAYGGGASDAFVTKFDPSLVGLIYSSFLGGKETDSGRGIAVDAQMDADVTGSTSSLNFPVVACFQCVRGGGFDAFVTSVAPPGNALNFSTYLGGKANDYGWGIAVNTNFNPVAAFVTGNTTSVNFPVGPCFQCASAGLSDAFVTRIP